MYGKGIMKYSYRKINNFIYSLVINSILKFYLIINFFAEIIIKFLTIATFDF